MSCMRRSVAMMGMVSVLQSSWYWVHLLLVHRLFEPDVVELLHCRAHFDGFAQVV